MSNFPQPFLALLAAQFVHDASSNPANVAAWFARRFPPGTFTEADKLLAQLQDELTLTNPNRLPEIISVLNQATGN